MQKMASSRVIIVTGASRGIGREIAICFGSAGNRVVVNYLRAEEEARKVVEEIVRQGGEAFSFCADVSRKYDIAAMVDETLRRWGAVDVLVNNAGIAKDSLLLRMSEQDWDDVLAVNLTGPFYCIGAVSRIMTQRRSGHIVSLASISGAQGREGQANYSASKAALIGLTKTAAKELGPFNICVNAIFPGYVQTGMGNAVSESLRERITAENTLGRTNDAREVSAFVRHLTTMHNVSGQVFNLDSRIH